MDDPVAYDELVQGPLTTGEQPLTGHPKGSVFRVSGMMWTLEVMWCQPVGT